MADPIGGAAPNSTAPPLTQRRPRAREVLSRFMTNSTPTPNPTTGLPRSKSARNRQSPVISDENHAPEVSRSFEKQSIPSTVQRKLPPQRAKNNHHIDSRVSARPDTPVAAVGTVVSSRYRQLPTSVSRTNSLNSSSNGCAAVTAAARLLQETLSRDDSDLCKTSEGISSSCPNSPICAPSTKHRVVHDIRSSMSDLNKWISDRNSCKSDCVRSINLSGGGISLPPHPTSYIRSGLDPKKGRKVPDEDVHCLKILSNQYLQWRFAVAKAGASFDSQKQEAKKTFLSLGSKLSQMRDDVQKKRSEVAILRRMKILTTIVEAQMPRLDEWGILDKEYSNSLSETINALLNSSARLPVSGNVRADAGELEEALGSAFKAVEMIGSQIQRFIPKAEELDTSVSELARMAGGERALVEECGDLISKTYVSQVKECSLRSSLIQVGNMNLCRKQE